ncbi:MAG TPA: adenylate/guanylate cyclase domain-containing protein [Candidatus Kapabacteria bacterium]|nr:adenylate/guanylate cyclase domain-containing protein [Candidatus Kapabacteria bacterium]
MRPRTFTIALLWLVGTLLTAGVTRAQSPPIELREDVHEVPIGDRVDVAIDTASRELSATPRVPPDLAFTPSRQTIPNFDVDQRAVYWFRADLVSSVDDVDWYLMIGNPTVHRVDVLVLDGDSVIDHTVLGTIVPFDQRSIRARVPVARLSLAPERPMRVLVRIEGGLIGHYFPLTIVDGAALAETTANQSIVYGVFVGFMLFMISLSLAFALALREMTYAYYAASMSANVAIILVIDGVLFQYLFTSTAVPVAGAYVTTVAIMQVTSILFGRAYLKSRAATPRLDRVILAILAIVVAMPATWLIDPRTAVSATTATAATYFVALFAVGVVQMRRGSRPAAFFLASWIVYIICSALITLYYRGDYPYFFIYFGMIGTALHAMILSFGLADATRVDRREKRLIQERALAHQTELATSFSRFVPQEILGLLGRAEIKDVALGDVVQRELTVLFSDIRSFTTISERLGPRETFEFLNAYLGLIGPLIRQHGGFIDKYVGDAIMAVFPTSPGSAVDAGLAMLETLRHYNATAAQPVRIGIGIHTGQAMLGTIGERERMDGTVIADAVNLASRLESLTKEYDAKLLVTHDVVRRLDPARYQWQRVDSVVVRGKSEATEIFGVGLAERIAVADAGVVR